MCCPSSGFLAKSDVKDITTDLFAFCCGGSFPNLYCTVITHNFTKLLLLSLALACFVG